MQEARNPETGETAVLVGGEWKKADQIAQNASGEKAYLIGGQWITDSAQPRSMGSELVRQLGLTARAGVEGLTALPNMVGDAVGLRSSQAVSQGLTKLGLPEPASATERVVQDVAGSLAGLGGVAKTAQLASPTSTVGQGIVRALTEKLAQQSAATAAASGGAGVTREMGGGPESQLAAGLVAGLGIPIAAQKTAQAVPNLIASSVRKSEATPFAREGQRLRAETGMDLTTGQETGNKLVLGLENTARQYGPLADRVQELDVKIANQAVKRVEEIADSISTSKADPATLGTEIENTVKNAARQLDTVRDGRAEIDYGKVREIAGTKPVVKLDSFATELRKIIGEFENVVGADAQKVTAQAKAALERITGEVAPATPAGNVLSIKGAPLQPATPAQTGAVANTISDAMKSRSFYGKAARGSANVFDDISPNLNRAIGARLFGAINRDFDQAAANTGGALRKALDTANGNYKAATQSLEFLEKSTLGKLVGEDVVDAALSGARASTTAGETVVSRLASAPPSSRATAMDILSTWNPQLAKDVRANVLRDALEKGMSVPPSAKGASQVPVSFNRFITALGGEKTSFDRQLQSYGFQPKEISEIKDTVAAMLRAGDRTGMNTSNTNVAAQNMELVSTMGAAVTGNVPALIKGALSIAGKRVALSQVASAMESPAGREALRTISTARASPQAVAAAFETVQSEPPTEASHYWSSKAGDRMKDLPFKPEPKVVTPEYRAAAARWVASQADSGGRYLDPEKLATALNRTAPELRAGVLAVLMQQRRIPKMEASTE